MSKNINIVDALYEIDKSIEKTSEAHAHMIDTMIQSIRNIECIDHRDEIKEVANAIGEATRNIDHRDEIEEVANAIVKVNETLIRIASALENADNSKRRKINKN